METRGTLWDIGPLAPLLYRPTATVMIVPTRAGRQATQVVTDAPAAIPAGNPPLFGVVTVSAHATLEGSRGNIAALDIDGLCCAAGAAVKNTAGFRRGQDAGLRCTTSTLPGDLRMQEALVRLLREEGVQAASILLSGSERTMLSSDRSRIAIIMAGEHTG
jgi:hypothetical protein